MMRKRKIPRLLTDPLVEDREEHGQFTHVPSRGKKTYGKNCPCIVPGCKAFVRRLSRHLYRHHLPPAFGSCKLEEINHTRLEILHTLADWIGGKNSPLEVLLQVLNYDFDARERDMSEESMKQVFEFGKLNGWPCTNLRLSPPNSIACLIHWRVAAELLCHLSTHQRQELITKFTENKESVQISSDDSSTVTPHVVCQPQSNATSPCADITTTIANTKFMEVIDSHFHMDRLQRQSGRSPRCSLDELIHSSKVKPRLPVKLLGGVQVFCDPEYFPEVPPSMPGFVAAFGVHPRHVGIFGPQQEADLEGLLSFSLASPLGEIGLDFTVSQDSWKLQCEVFQRLLTLCNARRPLILHLSQSTQSQKVYDQALLYVKQFCASSQKIHLHCFTGTCSDVRNWSVFPFCYFGFTGMVGQFNAEQREALRAVPINRLLLESDSPHLNPVLPSQMNTPLFLGDVATLVANIRLDQVLQMVEQTNSNARILYNLSC